MKFLVTNDDGIEAAGLNALVTAAQNLGTPIIIAPAGPQSGVSHAVTWKEGVRIEPRGDSHYAIHGTPADCTRLGLLRIVPDANWVLSGINHGSNLGADMYYSGTVAAAGLIGFIGLLVPHLVRLAGARTHRAIIGASALAGASLVVAADLIARVARPPAELPLGAVTALIGVPFFLTRLRRLA